MTESLDPSPTETHPAAPADMPPIERGKVYESLGPRGEKLVLMTDETWVDMGTNIESIRQFARNRDRLLNEEKGNSASLEIQLADARRRLENLRAIRRAEKRPEVEKAFNMTGDTNG